MDITEYAHRGKKMRVDAIAIRERYTPEGRRPDLEFVFKGAVLKLDQTPGQHRAESILKIPDIQLDDGLDEAGKQSPSPSPKCGQ